MQNQKQYIKFQFLSLDIGGASGDMYITLSPWEEHYQFDPDVAVSLQRVVTTSGYRWRFCTSILLAV